MGALTDLWKSERGLFAIVLVLAATAMVFTGHMTVEQWTGFSQIVGVAYIIGKSATSIVETVKAAPADEEAEDPTAPSMATQLMEFLRATAAQNAARSAASDARMAQFDAEHKAMMAAHLERAKAQRDDLQRHERLRDEVPVPSDKPL